MIKYQELLYLYQVYIVSISTTKANNLVSVRFQSGELIPYLESVHVNFQAPGAVHIPWVLDHLLLILPVYTNNLQC
jgi:hypothetical protein